jgi:predicted HTH domain antitoxin
MPLTISDEQLQSAGLSPDEARVEIACRLFQAGRLELWPAAQMAGLSRVEMEEALLARRIPIYVVTEEDLAQDSETLRRLSPKS